MMKGTFGKKWILIVVVIAALFGNIWVSYPDIMEIRNFVAAREMVTDGNWLIPTMNGSYRFEKPPLPTWITAGLMKAVGITAPEWMLRIPAALMGVLFMFLLYKMVKLLTKEENIAMMACFTGATTIMFTNLSNENMWDIYNYVFSFAAVFFTLKGFKTNKNVYFLLSAPMIGASILSKGPVGLYIIYAPFFIAYSAAYGIKDLKKYWKQILFALFIGVLLAGLWPLGMYIKNKEIFMQGIFESVVDKEVGTWTNRKQESIFYYFDYPAYAVIWMMPLIFGFFKNWSGSRTRENKFLNMALIWNLLIFICLSVVGMKKKRYTLPLFMISPMILGVVCTYYLNISKERLKKSDKILLGFQRILMAALCVFVPAVFFIFGYPKGTVTIWYPVFCLLIFAPFLWLAIKGNPKMIIMGGGIVMLLGNLTSNWYIDRHLRGVIKKKRAIKHDYSRISIFRKEPLKDELYSFDPGMREVWSMGKKINNLSHEKYKDIQKIPDRMTLLTTEPSEKLAMKLPEYKIVEIQNFYRDEDNNSLIYFYKVTKN